MPELPEVENVRLSLLPLIQGKTITAIGTNWEKILTGGLAHFQQTLVGHTVTGLDRRGKYLLFRFDHGVTMVSHLRMEGKYQVVPYPTVPFGRFAHVWFTFSDDSQLRYHDMRKFGRMQLIATGQEYLVSGCPASARSRRRRNSTWRRLPPSSRRARPRLSPCCWIKPSSPASATSTPTRRCGRHGSIRNSRRAP